LVEQEKEIDSQRQTEIGRKIKRNG